MPHQRLGSLKWIALGIGAVMLIVLLLASGILIAEQRRVAAQTRLVTERALPQLQEAAEAGRQLERLRATGDLLVARAAPEQRRPLAAAASEIAAHPALRGDPVTAAVVDRAAALLQELAKPPAGEPPAEDGILADDVVRERLARQWEPMAGELAAAADNRSQRDAWAAAAEGAALTRANERNAAVILGTLAVLAIFVAGGFALLHRSIHEMLVELEHQFVAPSLAAAPPADPAEGNLAVADDAQPDGEAAARREESPAESHTDPLSGLPNRLACEQLTAREFDRARRYDRPLSALVLNIDHLGRINEEYGTSTGDQVVRVVASRVRNLLRDADIAARPTPEQFIVFAPETPAEMAIQLAERLRLVIADQAFRFSDGREIPVTISIGVAELAPTDGSIATLLERADAALADAKLSGRNGVVLNV